MNTEINPWSIKGKRMIYDNPWITVIEHQVVTPSGADSIYTTVEYKHLAIGIVPLDEQYNTWIVGQWRFPVNQYSWEIPEGGGKMSESPLQAAQRELLEECGLVAKQWDEVMQFNTSNSVATEKAIIFLARQLQITYACPEPDEILQVKKIPFEELYQKVMDGRVSDSLTIAAVLKIKCMMHEGKV